MKPLVFISHIGEEDQVAKALKELIEPHFLGLLDVFVSSDGGSIEMGQKWLDTVSAALKNCAIQIVVCSPKSVARPWVNFEAGAAWVREVPVIPLCHSGMTPSELPIPLSLLQAANLTDVDAMRLVIARLAKVLGSSAPKVDLTAFVEHIRAFEEHYTFWDQCNSAFGVIAGISPDIIPALRSSPGLDMDLPPQSVAAIEGVSRFLRSNELLDFHRLGRSGAFADRETGHGGEFRGCELLKLPKLDATMASPHFKPLVKEQDVAMINFPFKVRAKSLHR
jgi:hypothetical protein